MLGICQVKKNPLPERQSACSFVEDGGVYASDLSGNDLSTECVDRIHSVLLELIDYSCYVGARK